MSTARLRADGVKVPIEGGEAVLRFSLFSLSLLEDEFGTIKAAWNKFVPVVNEGTEVDGYTAVIGSFLAAGMSTPGDVVSRDDALHAPTCDVHTLIDLVVEAVNQAFPDPGKAEADDKTKGSTGKGSTTRSPSAGTARKRSSGR